MKRRTLLAGVGSLTAASSMVLGSGAFTNVSAARTVNVELADDNQSLLALHERGEARYAEGGRSNKGGDTLSFSFPGVGERINDPDTGLGVDSVYEFTQDSGEASKQDPEQGLARIQNQGTQPVEVYSAHETNSDLEIELFDVTDSDWTALRDDPVELTVGAEVHIGVRIRTQNGSTGEFDETLTIIADQPDE